MGLNLSSAAGAEYFPPMTGAGSASSMVFQLPQAVHLPFHFEYSCPHSLHTNTVFGFAIFSPFLWKR